MAHNDSTPEVLAVPCTQCGRGVRQRCKNPNGADCLTHRARWAAAGLPMPARKPYERARRHRSRR